MYPSVNALSRDKCKVHVHFLTVPRLRLFLYCCNSCFSAPKEKRADLLGQPCPVRFAITSSHPWFGHGEVSVGAFPGSSGQAGAAQPPRERCALHKLTRCFFHRRNLIYDQRCHLCLASWSTTQISPKVLRSMKKQKVLMAQRRKYQK